MATAKRGHTSEMDNSPRDEEMLDAIKRRTREIYRVKTGKASETPQRPVQQDVDETGPSAINNIGERSTGNDLTMQALWDKISNMVDVNKRQIESHTEIIANLAANMLTVQDADKDDNEVNLINNNNESDLSDNGLEDISDDDDDELNIDDIVDANDDAENKAFLDELEKMYEEPKKFGDSIDNQMAKLVDQAINKPMKTETLTKLEELYLVPENCKRLQVPKVNKEIWRGFKSKKQRDLDLALQNVQKCMTTTLLMVVKSLNVMKSGGDMNEVKNTTKDMFKMLTHGIYTSNRKRKQLITPGVPFKYRRVTDVDTPVTEYLFGDNLDTKLEDLEKEDRRINKLSFNDSFLEGRRMEKRPGPPWKKPPPYFQSKHAKTSGQIHVQKGNKNKKMKAGFHNKDKR
ncbi:unnamed protein product [Mytilus coruscus]|uniref:Uncharacterized protein n=1 Tax=Mytilus coruscus TaxID=42192 RepID=A0A6J8E8X6_MYTCO|nr:unnamed protein product [Mytilus coruscus]